jgi:hypothetical protein
VAVVAALAAALLYALASVLQQWEAERQPSDQALRISLVARLAKRPRWLAGLCFDVGGYVAQWLALSLGSLIVVQPLLVLGLLFALLIKARLTSSWWHGWDWTGAFLMSLGLAVFLVVSHPAAGHANVKTLTWVLLLCGGVAVVFPLLLLGRAHGPRWKAMAYGTAGGVVYGICAALTKTCAQLLSIGFAHLLATWQPYVLVTAGVAGMVLAQSAFQAGPLDVSLPSLSASDPLVSVVIGALAFGETVRTGALPTTLEVISFSAIVAGIFMLAHTDAGKAAEQRPVHPVGTEPQAAG